MIRFDLDEQGHPILVNLDFSSVDIEEDYLLRPPINFGLGAIRFLDFPSRASVYSVLSDPGKSLFHIAFSGQPCERRVQGAPGAVWELDSESCLRGLWLLKSQDDPYGRGRIAWRARSWQQARLRALDSAGGEEGVRISPISSDPES